MPMYEQDYVRIDGCVIAYDGVTRPEIQQQGDNAGKPKWTLKVLVPPQSPDLGLFDQLSRRALQTSKFRGQLPAGGRMPIGLAQPGEFNDMFLGWAVINAKSGRKAPDVYSEDGKLLSAIEYGRLIFTGQRVNVLVGCYEYDKAGNKGISAGLEAIQIVTSANAQFIALSGSGVNTAGAFGGGGTQPPQQPQYQPPQQPPGVQQAHHYLPPQ